MLRTQHHYQPTHAITIRHTASVESFVGVCNVRTADEYQWLVSLAQRLLPARGWFVMAGIKDPGAALASTVRSEMVRPFIHCDYNGAEQFEYVVERNLWQTHRFARGLQLNVLPWMDRDITPILRSIKERHPQFALVLQAHKEIMDRYTPRQIAQRLRGMPVDYIFFDPSQSQGEPYDPVVMRTYLAAVHEQALPIGVAVAGGLGPGVMQRQYQPLAAFYPGLSCDGFTRLQDTAAHTLSMPAVEQYLSEWYRVRQQSVS